MLEVVAQICVLKKWQKL